MCVTVCVRLSVSVCAYVHIMVHVCASVRVCALGYMCTQGCKCESICVSVPGVWVGRLRCVVCGIGFGLCGSVFNVCDCGCDRVWASLYPCGLWV